MTRLCNSFITLLNPKWSKNPLAVFEVCEIRPKFTFVYLLHLLAQKRKKITAPLHYLSTAPLYVLCSLSLWALLKIDNWFCYFAPKMTFSHSGLLCISINDLPCDGILHFYFFKVTIYIRVLVFFKYQDGHSRVD